MRPRKHDRHLPACLYLRGKTYYYVKRGKWTPIAKDYAAALRIYARLVSDESGTLMSSLIAAALPDVLKGRVGKGLAASTAKQYRHCAGRLSGVFAEFTPAEVKATHVVQMRRSVAKVSPAVANRMLTVLRLVFDWAVEQGTVEANPCTDVHREHTESRGRLLDLAEVRAIQAKAPPRLVAIIDLCILTGQRIGDVLAIRHADVLQEVGIQFVQQKTGAELIVAWTTEIGDAIKRAIACSPVLSRDLLFCSRKGQPLRHQMVWRQWRTACSAAEIEDARIHDLRALAATLAKRQGLDPQALLGHDDASTTEIYLRDNPIPLVRGPSIAASIGSEPIQLEPHAKRRGKSRP